MSMYPSNSMCLSSSMQVNHYISFDRVVPICVRVLVLIDEPIYSYKRDVCVRSSCVRCNARKRAGVPSTFKGLTDGRRGTKRRRTRIHHIFCVVPCTHTRATRLLLPTGPPLSRVNTPKRGKERRMTTDFYFVPFSPGLFDLVVIYFRPDNGRFSSLRCYRWTLIIAVLIVSLVIPTNG